MTRKEPEEYQFVHRRAGHVMVAHDNRLFVWGGYMVRSHRLTQYLALAGPGAGPPARIRLRWTGLVGAFGSRTRYLYIYMVI